MDEPRGYGGSRTEGWWAQFVGEDSPGGFPANSGGSALEVFRVVKSGAGTLFGFTVYNSGAQCFVLLFDGTAAPASGAVPTCAPFPVAAASTLGVNFGTWGRAFDRGLVIASSSTASTYTATSAVCWYDAQYV